MAIGRTTYSERVRLGRALVDEFNVIPRQKGSGDENPELDKTKLEQRKLELDRPKLLQRELGRLNSELGEPKFRTTSTCINCLSQMQTDWRVSHTRRRVNL